MTRFIALALLALAAAIAPAFGGDAAPPTPPESAAAETERTITDAERLEVKQAELAAANAEIQKLNVLLRFFQELPSPERAAWEAKLKALGKVAKCEIDPVTVVCKPAADPPAAAK